MGVFRQWRALAAAFALAWTASLSGADLPARPRLVVLLVVDQMRADYIDKYAHQWTGGLRRLMREGAWFRQASYPYLTTVTCAGHGSIATGAVPRVHGIVSNSWWDRTTGKSLGCVSDPETTIVSYGAPSKTSASARHLRVSTLPDELRMQVPVRPRIVTMSMKDYTATMLAGRRADVAVWFEASLGTWASSSAYGAAPVPFVAEFLKANPIDAAFGLPWTRLLPESSYLFEDDGVGEAAPKRGTTRFPHVLQGASDTPDSEFYAAWEESPFSDAFMGKLAERAIDALELGRGPGIDYLAISFSTLDLVGHDYGPRSHEVQDVLARLDRTLGSLLARLDQRVGPRGYVVALMADHGVSPIPEQAAASGVPAGRIPTATISARVDQALGPWLGPGKHVARISYNDLYFATGVMEKLRATPAALRAAVEAIRSMPGVARVLSADELDRTLTASDDRLDRAAAASFDRERSGDLVIVLRPYWLFGSSKTGTNHGSAYDYDQQVPLFLMGHGIVPGQYLAPASPLDAAPTLAFLCGIRLPAATGRVLREALAPAPALGHLRPPDRR